MTHYGMIIDVGRCVGCYNCFIACKDEFWDNDYPPYSRAQPDRGQYWIRLKEKERNFPQIVVRTDFVPIPCMHCRDPPCLKAARDGAVYVREDGIVMIDPEKSKGQRQIVDACPYGVIYWNEELQIPQKCTFCAHLLDQGWRRPRCVEACPADAMIFGDLDDPDSELSKLWRSAEALSPEQAKGDLLAPPGSDEYGVSVKYLRLPKPIVGGSVIFGDTGECAEGVRVTVRGGDGVAAETVTNAFGDFMVEGLRMGGKYVVRLEHPDYQPKELEVTVNGDVNLGEVRLDRR
ncbi:MAG: 4Fe-4S dicluster domain-containing protein [Nitrososphaeria archaeon]